MYDGPIIDFDVHYHRASDQEVTSRLPDEWRGFLERNRSVSLYGPLSIDLQPDGPNRLDTIPPNGRPPGADYATMCEQLLDRFPIEYGLLLNSGPPALPNGPLSAALCRATNDWTRDVWLDGIADPRLKGTIVVETHDPTGAAAEIRRVGQDARFVAVHIGHNALGRPLGHPVFHPIYEAAAELDLPIVTHVNAGEQFGTSSNFIGGGAHVHFRAETYVAGQQATVNHLVSMIAHGVFEKYPSLTYVMMEAGVSWLVWLAMRLDTNYELFREESSWVKRWPSEYLHDHAAVTTQPCEASAGTRLAFVEELSLIDGIEDMLLYSSDYPHWDFDDPRYIAAQMPEAWHEKVFHENARRILRLPSSRPAAVA